MQVKVARSLGRAGTTLQQVWAGVVIETKEAKPAQPIGMPAFRATGTPGFHLELKDSPVWTSGMSAEAAWTIFVQAEMPMLRSTL